MNEPYETKNRLAKAIALKAADLLEHFQWGRQSVDDQSVLNTIQALEKNIEELKKTLRD